MEMIYGLALMSASVLLLFYAARFRNAPNAPGWSQSNVFVQTILFTTVVGLIFGFSMLIMFGTHFSAAGFGALEIGLLIVIAAVTWAGWAGIQRMPAPRSTTGIDPTGDLPPPANTDGAPLRAGRKHKAA